MGDLLRWWDGLDEEDRARLLAAGEFLADTEAEVRRRLVLAEIEEAEELNDRTVAVRADEMWHAETSARVKQQAIDRMNQVADTMPLPVRARIRALSAHILRPDAERGWKQRDDARKGGHAKKGSRKGPPDEVLRGEVRELQGLGESLTNARKRVAREHHLSLSTIRRRTAD